MITPLVLDYDADTTTSCLIRNLSASARTITAVSTTPTGTTTQTFTVNAGVQRLFEFRAQDYLAPGQRVTGDVRLSYSGSPADIIVGAVNISTEKRIAVCSRTIEASASQGRRLQSPYFALDGRDLAVVQLTNLGATNVLVGAKLAIADVTDSKEDPSRTSALVTVPAYGTATLDLEEMLNDAPEGYAARGALEIVHNGHRGAISASFYSSRRNSDVQVASLQPVATVPSCYALLAFPSHVTLMASASVQIAMVSDGTVTTPGIRTENGGTATPATVLATNVYATTYTAPSRFTSEARMVSFNQATQAVYQCGGTDVEPTELELESNPPTRLNPDGNTPFTLTAKGQNTYFPANVDMIVSFRQNSATPVTTLVRLTTQSHTLSGTAPTNVSFIGDVTSVRVDDSGGNRIAKIRKKPGFYYAFDPPSREMTADPDTLNRAGGFVRIYGSGFRKFKDNVFPTVQIGEIDYTVTAVSDDGTYMDGHLGRALYAVATCTTSNPCRNIKVANPGGQEDEDRVVTPTPRFTLTTGPFPVGNGFKVGYPDRSNTAGGVVTVIVGTNLWNLRAVTFGSRTILYDSLQITDDEVTLTVPANCQTGNVAVRLADIDNASPNNTVGSGWIYAATNIAAVGAGLDGLPMYVKTGQFNTPLYGPYTAVYRVGPGACNVVIDADPSTGSIGPMNCGTWSVTVVRLSDTTVSVTVLLNATGCNLVQTGTGSISFRLTSTEQGAQGTTIGMTYTILQ